MNMFAYKGHRGQEVTRDQKGSQGEHIASFIFELLECTNKYTEQPCTATPMWVTSVHLRTQVLGHQAARLWVICNGYLKGETRWEEGRQASADGRGSVRAAASQSAPGFPCERELQETGWDPTTKTHHCLLCAWRVTLQRERKGTVYRTFFNLCK